MRDVALEIPLCFLALDRCAQGDDAANARIEALGDRLDCYALAGGGAALKQHDDLQAALSDPLLQLYELDPETPQLLVVAAVSA